MSDQTPTIEELELRINRMNITMLDNYKTNKQLQSSLSAALAVLREVEGRYPIDCPYRPFHGDEANRYFSNGYISGSRECASIVTKFFNEHPELNTKPIKESN